jgi:hypothetical protein
VAASLFLRETAEISLIHTRASKQISKTLYL